jgi:Domain of unknown function DUF29
MSETIVNDPSRSSGQALYEADLYAWTKAQADALRRRAAAEVDWDNLAEEIESLGRSEKREVASRLEVLLLHLLKWKYQPQQQCPSWRASIRDARDELERVLEDNPSLRGLPGERLVTVYPRARMKALEETGLYRLPEACPWTIAEVLDAGFLP